MQGVYSTGGIAIRSTLTESTSFAEARRRLERTWLTTPAYLIIAGESTGDGVCLARSRHRVESFYEIGKGGEGLASNFVAQANSDWWKYDSTPGDQDPIPQLVMSNTPEAKKRGKLLLEFAACGKLEQRCVSGQTMIEIVCSFISDLWLQVGISFGLPNHK